MNRIACVDIPALPLQLLLRSEPGWRDRPVVVVRDDRPQGEVLWANTHARSHRILPGMTFAAARSLTAHLHAAVVDDTDIDTAVAELLVALCNFSPRVEPHPVVPGVYWIDPSGLTTLYGSLDQWSATIRRDLRARGFESKVVVGFRRFAVYALARSLSITKTGQWVAPFLRAENQQRDRVPLHRLDLSPDLRDGLAVLGVRTLGDFMRLPVAELAPRFGEEAARLHGQAGERWAPLTPRKLVDPIRSELQFEPPDDNNARLLFAIKGGLHGLLDQLATRSQALSALHLHFVLDHAEGHHEYLEPAAPTLEILLLVDLVRLRLESMRLAAAVVQIEIEVEGLRAHAGQLALFRTQTRRDLDAAGRALARLRASFGPQSVTRARLRPAHLPEASFGWEPVSKMTLPQPREVADGDRPLVRRVFARPVPLPPRPRQEQERWLGRHGAVRQMFGPFRVSGGWWVRTVERDYYYAETLTGEILWIYYDRPRRRWFQHGVVD